MGKIETRDLGQDGRNYVRKHLRDINVFCAALLDTVNSEPEEAFTFAPASTPAERLSKFEYGGLLPENLSRSGAIALPDGSTLVPVVSLVEERTRLLRETMASARGAACIIDDVNPRWSDPPSYLGPGAFGVGEEVYHLLTVDHAEGDFLDAVHCGNALWHGVAAVCRLAPKLDHARTSTPSELEASAASALLITCVAYDGEGFVAWRRSMA
jgi:hypothetical protein